MCEYRSSIATLRILGRRPTHSDDFQTSLLVLFGWDTVAALLWGANESSKITPQSDSGNPWKEGSEYSLEIHMELMVDATLYERLFTVSVRR